MPSKNINIKVGYAIDKSGLDDLKKQLGDIRRIAETAKVSGKLTDGLQEASKAATELEKILNSAWNSKINQLDLSKVNTSIKTTYGSVQKLQESLVKQGTLGVSAYNNFARAVLNSNIQLKQASQTLDKMAVTFKNTIRYGISSSVFNNLSNSLQKAYNYTVQLDTSLNDIRIVTGKSADEMNNFAIRANRVARELGRSTKDFTNAALIYYQQGLGNEESQARAAVTMKAANVTGQSGREVSEQLTAVWNGYKVTAEEAELYVDKLAAVAAATAADLEELSTGMSKVASAANIMGVDIDQLNAQLATIVSVTRQAPESVGTALKTIYARMSNIKAGLDDETTLSGYTEKMAQMGVNVLNANGNLRDMGEVIEEIGNKWASMSREQQVALSQTIAGTRQYNNLLSLFDNWDMYTQALETSANAAGELQREQDIYMESTEAHLQVLAAEAEKTYSILFDQDAARGFIDVMEQALSVVNAYLTGLGGGMKTLTTLGLQVSNIFSKQISGAIVQQLENTRIQNESQDIAQLKEDVIANKGWNQETGLNEEQEAALAKELEYAEKISSVKRALTQEEYQQLTAQQEELGNLQEQIVHYEKISAEMDDIAKKYGIIATEDNFRIELANTVKEGKKLQSLLDDLDNNKWNDTPETQAQYTKFLQQSGMEEKEINAILNNENELRARITAEIQRNQYQQDELNGAVKTMVGLDEEDYEAKVAQANSIQNSINKTVELKNEQMRIQTIIRGTTTILSTFTALQGIATTLGDEELSGWEKFSSVMSVIAVQGITLLSGLKEIGNLLPALAVQLGVIGAEEQAINAFKKQGILLSLTQIAIRIKDIALTKLQVVWQAILNVLKGDFSALGVAAIAAIVGLTVAIGAWIVSIVEANTEERKLNETLESNKEKVKEAKEAYQELKDTISTYSDARKAIDDLTEGTVEFYDALIKSNEAAQELIDKFNLMVGSDYTIDKNGLININPDVLADRQFRSQQEVYRSQANVNSAQAALERYNQTQIVKQFVEEVNRQPMTVSLTEGQARKILDNSDKTNYNLTELYSDVDKYGNRISVASETASVDITKAMAKYMAPYNQRDARLRSEQNQYASNLIRGYGDKSFVDEYNAMTTAQQENINTYVAKQVANNAKNLKVTPTTGDIISQGLLNGLLNIATFGTVGTMRAYNQAQEFNRNRATVREAYAKSAYGYYQQNGAWYDRYGKSLDYEKDIQSIDADLAAAAYNSGELVTIDSAKRITEIIRKSKAYAYAQGASDTEQNYIAEAFTAIKVNNQDYDFSLLTNNERQIVRSMLGERQTKTWTGGISQNNVLAPITPLGKQQPNLRSPLTPIGQGMPMLQTDIYSNIGITGMNADAIDKYLADTEEIGQTTERVKADLQAYNSELEAQAKALGTTSKALDLYGQAMRKADKVGQEFNKDNAKSIADAYNFNKAYNKTVKTYKDTADAYEIYIDALKNGKEISYDVADSVAELETDLESMLGLDISPQFLEDNYDDIKTMLTGTAEAAEDAYNRIQASAIQDALENSLGYSAEKAAEFINYLGTLDPGAELNKTWTDSLKEMINNSNLTVSQVEDLFANMHLEMPPPEDYELTEETATSSATSTKHTYKGKIPVPDVNAENGYRLEDIDYSWTETTEPVEQKYFKFKDQDVTLRRDTTSSKGSFGRSGAGNFTKTQDKGKSGGGSSKTKEPDKMDQITDESNRYHDIDIQLTQISTDLKRLEDEKKKLFGKDLISNINKQMTLLDKQLDATNIKIEIMNGELGELQEKLLDRGFTFDKDGVITNYQEVVDAKINTVKGLIDAYNGMTAEEQEKAKQGIEDAKKDLKETLELSDRYDTLKYKDYEDLINDKIKILDEKITKNIEKFDMEIEIRLDMAEAERDWNKFKRKIIDGIKDDDILGVAGSRLADFASYYKEENKGSVQALTTQVNKTLAELRKMDAGEANVYGDNKTKALDDLKKYYNTLMTNLEAVQDLQNELYEDFIKEQDEVQKKFDKQVETYEMIGDLIDHDMKVIQLVYGDKSYSALGKYYERQEENNNKQLDFHRQQVDFWKKQMDSAEKGSKAWDNAREKWEDAVKNWKDLIIDSIEDLQDKYLNTINEIFDNLNNKVTDGLGLDYVNEQWTLINKNAEQYLDNINSLYSIQELENKYLQAIDKTDSVGAQRQLKELMDAELADLRERDKLTQYDIDRANKKYEIALKQIALQEAQQNKTKMRLRRDSQGNYRYEYVNDNDQVNQIQDELNGLYNSLYNFDKARYQENLGQIYSTWSEFQEKMAEAAQINDPQERAERELLLQEQYGELINGLVEQNTQIRTNLQDSAFEDLARLYDKDIEEFQRMSDTEIDTLMNSLVPQWESGVQKMADAFADDEDGFMGVCRKALNKLNDATKDYQNSLDDLQTEAGEDFNDIYNDIDETIDITEDLLDVNDDLIDIYDQELGKMSELISELDGLIAKYAAARDAAIEAAKAAHEYWSDASDEAADSAGADNIESIATSIGEPNPLHDNIDNTNADLTSSDISSNMGDGVLRVGDKVTYSGSYYENSMGGGRSNSLYSGVAEGVIVDSLSSTKYGGQVSDKYTGDYDVHIMSADGRYKDLGWVKKSQLSGYDTGGYTGAWGNDGRLALLHQKELVLNAHDTENMLNAVTIMRDITSTLGGSILKRLAGIAAAGINGTANDGVLDQNVSIQATFPNVTSSREIEDALNNLVNMAAIRANRKGS